MGSEEVEVIHTDGKPTIACSPKNGRNLITLEFTEDEFSVLSEAMVSGLDYCSTQMINESLPEEERRNLAEKGILVGSIALKIAAALVTQMPSGEQ